MDLRAEIKRQMNQLAQQSNGSQAGEIDVTLPDGGRISAQLADVQSIGCALHQLDFETPHAQRWDGDQVHSIGQQIADRVRYLFEPLQLNEVDPSIAAAQVRSAPPQTEGKTVRYYEVTAQASDGLRLVRYEKEPGSPRHKIPSLVTVEVLAQLCEDMTQIANSA